MGLGNAGQLHKFIVSCPRTSCWPGRYTKSTISEITEGQSRRHHFIVRSSRLEHLTRTWHLSAHFLLLIFFSSLLSFLLFSSELILLFLLLSFPFFLFSLLLRVSFLFYVTLFVPSTVPFDAFHLLEFPFASVPDLFPLATVRQSCHGGYMPYIHRGPLDVPQSIIHCEPQATPSKRVKSSLPSFSPAQFLIIA